MSSWDDFSLQAPGSGGAGHDQFPESGWGAALCWVIGPGRVVRSPVTESDVHSVRIEEEKAGATRRSVRPRTSSDQTFIDDSIDEYLAEADIPPRPRGFIWELAPSGRDDVTLDRLQRSVQEELDKSASPIDPAAVVRAGRVVLGKLRDDA